MPDAEPPTSHPYSFRLPRPARWKTEPGSKKKKKKIFIPSECDPHFGFTRSYYYWLESKGILKLIRCTDEGKDKGVTLVRWLDVWKYVQKQIADREQKAAA
jgi:hypothetical protein